MTEKKENILNVALQLFAEQGYESTPTSRIAKEAQVSEGLIFRHFESKEGLLMSILEDGYARVELHLERILQDSTAKEVLEKVIELPFTLLQQEKEFWAMQVNLKQQIQKLPAVQQSTRYQSLLVHSLKEAFTQLGYTNAAQEANLLLMLLSGLTDTLLQQRDSFDAKAFLEFLKSKYKL